MAACTAVWSCLRSLPAAAPLLVPLPAVLLPAARVIVLLVIVRLLLIALGTGRRGMSGWMLGGV